MQNPEPNTYKIAKLEPNILIDKIENGEKVPIYLLLSEFQYIEVIWRRPPSEIRPREAQPAATRIPEAEHHAENYVFVVETASF